MKRTPGIIVEAFSAVPEKEWRDYFEDLVSDQFKRIEGTDDVDEMKEIKAGIKMLRTVCNTVLSNRQK